MVKLSDKNNDMIPCPNYVVCGNYEHPDFLHNGRCLSCDINLGEWQKGRGNLEFKTIESCCICLDENLQGVSMPKCEHYICIECFKKCFDLQEEPFFPQELDDNLDELANLEEEFSGESVFRYYEIFAERHPEIAEIVKIYAEGCKQWKDNRPSYPTGVSGAVARYEENKRLSRCPLCRK